MPGDKWKAMTGPQKVFFNICLELSKQSNFKTFIYSPVKKQNELKSYEYFTVRKYTVIRMIFEMINMKFDIIHFVGFRWYCSIFLFLGIFLNSRILYTANGIVVYENLIGYNYSLKEKIAEKLIIKFSDKIIAVSNVLKKHIMKMYNTEESKIIVIGNGVEYNELINKLKEIAPELNAALKLYGDASIYKSQADNYHIYVETTYSLLSNITRVLNDINAYLNKHKPSDDFNFSDDP